MYSDRERERRRQFGRNVDVGVEKGCSGVWRSSKREGCCQPVPGSVVLPTLVLDSGGRCLGIWSVGAIGSMVMVLVD